MSLKIGLIGLDTSHVEIFARLLDDDKEYFEGARITHGCPHPSNDMALSINRVSDYTSILKNKYGAAITHSISELADMVDAIMITSVDGGQHLDIFRTVAPHGKPVFIDKPLALSAESAKEIFTLSEQHKTPIMSSSSLRYAASLQKQFANKPRQPSGVYLNGPLPFIENMPYYFWYGIHMIELLITIMGPDYERMAIQGNDDYDIISVQWEDGRFGLIRGDHNWHGNFEATLHYKDDETTYLPIYKDEKSYYACLLEEIMLFFKTGKSTIPKEETIRVIQFIEEANAQREKI